MATYTTLASWTEAPPTSRSLSASEPLTNERRTPGVVRSQSYDYQAKELGRDDHNSGTRAPDHWRNEMRMGGIGLIRRRLGGGGHRGNGSGYGGPFGYGGNEGQGGLAEDGEPDFLSILDPNSGPPADRPADSRPPRPCHNLFRLPAALRPTAVLISSMHASPLSSTRQHFPSAALGNHQSSPALYDNRTTTSYNDYVQ